MAIGHIDALSIPEGPLTNCNAQFFEQELKKVAFERSKRSISSHSKQTETFCCAIKKDDIVVTLDPMYLTVGRVVDDAYIDKTPIWVEDGRHQIVEMNHSLRRAVEWGPLVPRKQVPVAMEMSLFAHQTVFNIDQYWTSVYHLLYPCFSYQGRLYLSTNIQEQHDLDNYAISQLFSLLSGVEVMAKLYELDSDEWEQYPHNLPALRKKLDLSLSSKAEFMSPGTIWATLLLDSSTMASAAVIYVMLFGGDVKFFKADGLLDIKTRQKLWGRVLKLIETHDVAALKDQLKADIPRADTKQLEVSTKAKKKPRKVAVLVEDAVENPKK